MNLLGELPKMQITVTVSDEIVREAGVRGLPVIDFLESLIDKGFSAAKERPALTNAMRARVRSPWGANGTGGGGRCLWRADRLIGLQWQCLQPYGPACKSTDEGQEETPWIQKRVMP